MGDHDQQPPAEPAVRPFAALDDDEVDPNERQREEAAGTVAAPLMAGMSGGVPGAMGTTGGVRPEPEGTAAPAQPDADDA